MKNKIIFYARWACSIYLCCVVGGEAGPFTGLAFFLVVVCFQLVDIHLNKLMGLMASLVQTMNDFLDKGVNTGEGE